MREAAGRLAQVCFRSALAAALLAALSCHRASAPAAEPVHDPQEGITLVVNNHQWLDLRVFVVRGGDDLRLGTAQGQAATSFAVPSRFIRGTMELRFRVIAIGGRVALVTEILVVEPGQQVEWTIETPLSHSSVSVY